MKKTLCTIHVLLSLSALLLAGPPAQAQVRELPNAIRLVLPFPPGSGADSSGRFYGAQLSAVLGTPIVFDNRVGANALIAVAAVKNAPANGATMFLGSSASMVMNPILVKDLPYDPVKDFRPVSGLTRLVTVFAVAPESPFKNVADLVKAAKANKDKLTVGTFTASYELGQKWLGNVAGTEFLNVPFKGAGDVITNLMGGRLDFTILDIASAAPQFPSGKLRGIAVSSDKRHPDFPNIPTVVESGYPQYVNFLWNGFFVRAETPNDVTNRLADAMQKVLLTPESKDYASKVWAEVLPLGPAAMRKYHIDDLENLKRVANAVGIKPE